MKITLVAAMAHNRVIAYQGQMPWHMPADLKHFKNVTLNKPVIMGRKTFQSLGKPLPQRRNIIITRDQTYQAQAIEVVHSLDQALQLAKDSPEVIIGGGSEIYQLALPIATDLILTFIDADVPGDTFFPKWNEANWKMVDKQIFPADKYNPHAYQFVYFTRVAIKTVG